jgi:hypothetical protein
MIADYNEAESLSSLPFYTLLGTTTAWRQSEKCNAVDF